MKKMMLVLSIALLMLTACKQSAVKSEVTQDGSEQDVVKPKAPSFTTPVVLKFTDSTVILNDSFTCEATLKMSSLQEDSVTLFNYSKAIVDKITDSAAKNVTVVMDNALTFEKVFTLFRATSTVYDTFFLYHNDFSLPVSLPKPTKQSGLGFGAGMGSGFGPGGGGLGLGFSGGSRAAKREAPKPRLRLTTVVSDSQAAIITPSAMIDIPFVIEGGEAFYSARDLKGITKVWRHKESCEFLMDGLQPFSGNLEQGASYQHFSIDADGNYKRREDVVDPGQYELKPLRIIDFYLCFIAELRTQVPDAVDKDEMIYGVEPQVPMSKLMIFSKAAYDFGVTNQSYSRLRGQ